MKRAKHKFFEEKAKIDKFFNEKIRLRERIRIIIFDSHTPIGKLFDIVLFWLIIASVTCVILESMPDVRAVAGPTLHNLDWLFTVIFSIEYGLRIYSSKDRWKYMTSFWGIIDFLAIVPTVITLYVSGYQFLQVIRILRLLRVFKVLRLFQFVSEGYALAAAMKKSSYKIAIFMSFIFTLVVLLGTVMYVIEKGNPGFHSIPSSIYWGIVTITTVGFGDIVPHTVLGKIISSVIMLAGYAIIIVPTGIVSAEISRAKSPSIALKCDECGHINDYSHKFCSECGDSLLKEKLKQ